MYRNTNRRILCCTDRQIDRNTERQRDEANLSYLSYRYLFFFQLFVFLSRLKIFFVIQTFLSFWPKIEAFLLFELLCTKLECLSLAESTGLVLYFRGRQGGVQGGALFLHWQQIIKFFVI
jgi:hypothetical protein